MIKTPFSVGLVALLFAGSAAWADDRLAQGRMLYLEHCAACHGADLAGEADWRTRKPDGLMPAPPHDASGHTWHHPDEQLFTITKLGIEAVAPAGYKSAMIGFGDVLSDDEIWSVLDYIKSTWPERERAHQARLNSQ